MRLCRNIVAGNDVVSLERSGQMGQKCGAGQAPKPILAAGHAAIPDGARPNSAVAPLYELSRQPNKPTPKIVARRAEASCYA
jgi:hypothetical protein